MSDVLTGRPPSTSEPTDRPDQREMVIRTEGLTKRYGDRTAVRAISIDIPRGVVAGFVGPNGAGKTTTIRMLLGMVRPSEGSATVLGAPLTHPSDYMSRVGAMIEGPAYYPSLSGRSNLAILASLGGYSGKRVAEVLEIAGLTDRAADKVKGYSMGMKQRLGIAAALLPDPDLLILDEPTNGLDPSGILEVRHLMRSLRQEGKTIFVSSHLLSELEQVADWLTLIKEGAVLFSGPIDQLTKHRGSSDLVVVAEQAEQLAVVARIAHDHGHSSSVRDGRLHVAAPESFAGELNRASMRAGVTLTGIAFAHASLEETFFSMTEGDQ